MSNRSKIDQSIKVKLVESYLRSEIGLREAARQTTPEERLEIVRDCLANGKNYGSMALKYNCSYQQVRNWVRGIPEPLSGNRSGLLLRARQEGSSA